MPDKVTLGGFPSGQSYFEKIADTVTSYADKVTLLDNKTVELYLGGKNMPVSPTHRGPKMLFLSGQIHNERNDGVKFQIYKGPEGFYAVLLSNSDEFIDESEWTTAEQVMAWLDERRDY